MSHREGEVRLCPMKARPCPIQGPARRKDPSAVLEAHKPKRPNASAGLEAHNPTRPNASPWLEARNLITVARDPIPIT